MLQVIDLEKKYGDKTILDKVNFGLEKGQIKALVGPNGSGKTTLMNSISNSIKIDGGIYKKMYESIKGEKNVIRN